ncbi:MAG: SCO family protein, partial [Acidobacteriota bacterium]
VEAELPDDQPVKIVSFSIDPDFDTPEVLEAYAQQWDAPPRWLFLTGDRRAVFDLAAAGFAMPIHADESLPIDDPRALMHSSRFVLIDQAGQIRGYYSSLDQAEMDRLVIDAQRLMRAGNT